ncbi:MAG: anti-sigma factor [Pseudomonadota bacterium]|mgnify:CR=1 FL=1|nr:anti-sigma factor [Pseudomonadales bacterium]MDY6919490.1 anti-sigma factor [Pseudomonadota bacterium]
MLKCKDIAHEASDYVEHHQHWWRRLLFRLHLFLCANCRRFVRHLRLTRQFIRRRGAPASPQEVEQVLSQVESRHGGSTGAQ